jgi:modulator of FtsH protease HflC
MKYRWLLLIFLVLAAIAAYRSLVFVDESEFVIVTQFGRPVETIEEAGLHFKAPYQSALRIDRRVQIYNPRPSEFLAAEKKNVDLDVFVCWHVTEPQHFLETVSDLAGAESRIHDIVWSELAAEVGRNPVEALVSTDPKTHRLDALVAGVLKCCADRANKAYGIEIVDVRIKRIGLPAQVRDSVFERMRKERARMAEKYRSEGQAEAVKIRASADKERTITLAKAYGDAERIRGKAEAEAAKIYAAAHQQDPALFELLRTLETYKKILDEKTTILLSGDSDLLKFLTHGSMLKEQPERQKEQPEKREAKQAKQVNAN